MATAELDGPRLRQFLRETTCGTGYKVVRVIMKDGAPTGEYEDFATSFVINDSAV